MTKLMPKSCTDRMDKFGRCGGVYVWGGPTGNTPAPVLKTECFFCSHWDDAVKSEGGGADAE